MSLDVQSLDGWVGSVGDANSLFRELSGVDETRIRGATWRRQSERDGSVIAVAAGVPLSGSTIIDENASRPTFSGFAGGARFIAPDGSREIGISGAIDGNGGDDRFVFSLQREASPSEGETGLKNVFLSGDLGVFTGPQGTDVDARAVVQGRYKLSEQLGLQANVTYDGARFSQGGALRQTPDFEGVLDDGLGSRFVGTVSTDWRSVKDWGPVRNVAAGVRSTYSRVGGSNGSDSVAGTAGFSAQITPLDLDISVDATVSRNSVADGEPQVANAVNVRAFKRFDWGRAQATYTTASGAAGGQSDNRFVGSLQVNPIRRVFPKGASVSAGPNASVVVAEGEVRSRFGATLSANSGRLFGQKLSLQGHATALQSIDPADTSTDFFASLAATYRFSRALQLETNYFDNFNGGRDVSIALRGRLVFNEPRKHTR
ncbi:MAG: hypothetical protein AAFR01_13890, partial [Pseudomonadota bacterium]